MSGIHYRPDYAKFIFEVPRGAFDIIYMTLCRNSHERQYHGDFLKSHHVQALPCMNPDYETTVLEIWGEWAGLVETCPTHWLLSLKRYDVRAVLWDSSEEAIIQTGQHLQRTVTNYNVNVYSTRPASKRRGRSRGGKGFAIGSHKSDVRVTCYKRTGEPCAVEFQISGDLLKRHCNDIYARLDAHSGTIDLWRALTGACVTIGNARMMKVFEGAGIGSYWPVTSIDDVETPPELQTSFTALVPTKADLEEYAEWANSVDSIEYP